MISILFLRSGNSVPDPITTNQGNSLRKAGLDVKYFDIIGKGVWGYLRNIPRLRKYIRETKPDLIHAHFSYSAYLATLSNPQKKIICSLMGSDVLFSNKIEKMFIKIFIKIIWEKTIVKSQSLKASLGISDVAVIPNGINMSHFSPVEQTKAKEALGFNEYVNYILFASDPTRPEKNYKLAEEIFIEVKKVFPNSVLVPLKNIPIEKMPLYFNAANLLLSTSLSEGSPNVIKEAMACNCPIVATNVGDINEVVLDTIGCTVSNFNKSEMVQSVLKLLQSPLRTNGREKIFWLDDRLIAEKLVTIYSEVLAK